MRLSPLKCAYNKFKHDESVTINSYKVSLPLYGRYCDLSFSFYHVSGETTINFGLKASTDAGMDIKGTCNKIFRIYESKRQIEQEIVVPHLIGNVLDSSNLIGSGKDGANVIAERFIEVVESIIETVRQSIVNNFSCSCKDRFVDLIDNLYDKYTKAISKFLLDINWAFLFNGIDIGIDFLSALESLFSNRALRILSASCHKSNISIIKFDLLKHAFDKGRIADLKAAALLGQVCGKSIQEEFKRFGSISLSKDGYDFVLRPNHNPECVDPFGNKAHLCIHTPSFSCNPIDEICINYLHITSHLFYKWLATANIFAASNFVVPEETKRIILLLRGK